MHRFDPSTLDEIESRDKKTNKLTEYRSRSMQHGRNKETLLQQVERENLFIKAVLLFPHMYSSTHLYTHTHTHSYITYAPISTKFMIFKDLSLLCSFACTGMPPGLD